MQRHAHPGRFVGVSPRRRRLPGVFGRHPQGLVRHQCPHPGKHTNTASWELLAEMFIGQASFGLPGLVAAPLYYGYAKKEWQAGGWI